MLISELTDRDAAVWDAYVRSAPLGLPQHLSNWRAVLYKTYGYETYYQMAWRSPHSLAEEQAGQNGSGAQLSGVLPLFLIPSALFGRTLTTLPGGLCADDAEVAESLIEHGMDLARRLHARRFVIHDTRQPWPGALETACQHETWLVDVRCGAEELWTQLDRNIRRQVRMAQRNQLRAEVDRRGDRLDDFYQVMSRFTHQSGTPIFGRSFLDQVTHHFAGQFSLVMVYLHSEPIGGYFQLEMGRTNYGIWGATLHEYLDLRPVYLAYWEILNDTTGRGLDYLDMGRSPRNSNSSKYKGQWGGQAAPVYQQTAALSRGVRAESMATRAQGDGALQSFRQIWPKLPFPVAQALGPVLRRHVPFG
jgi:hypothetical protein